MLTAFRRWLFDHGNETNFLHITALLDEIAAETKAISIDLKVHPPNGNGITNGGNHYLDKI